MKKFILCFFILMTLRSAFAQKVYFVYLQTQPEQPFFVRMNDKVFSSTASGYLILSNLYDSTYNLVVGFPQNKWPDQKFSITVNKKDYGYLIENFGEKGWGLYDLQTMAVQMASANETTSNVAVNNSKVSAFTEVLAKATDDSTLLQKPVAQITEEKKTEPLVQTVEKNDTNKVSLTEQSIKKQEADKNDTLKMETKRDEQKPLIPEIYKRSVVTRKSESSTTTGFSMVFLDDYGNGMQDTIRIFIPAIKEVVKTENQEPKQERKFLDIISDTQKPDSAVTNKPTDNRKTIQDSSAIISNSSTNNCKLIAEESDFFELRKSMAADTTDDDMINEAKKYFKTKCFSTEQIKNLSTLFLNDEGKYKFFDAAYSYVSDANNFNSLQSELKDNYYINRFKAMLRN